MASAPPSRQLKHRRSISIEAFARDDGLWDIEARLTDIKARDIELASGMRAAGDPIHDMHLRVTIDTRLNVVDVAAESRAVPYPGQCELIAPDYRKLIGLNLLQGFRHAVRERMGGIAGCTHMSELTAVLPTAAIQAFAGEGVRGSRNPDAQNEKPFQLDRCHALRSDGASVRQYYPKWYVAPKGDAAENS